MNKKGQIPYMKEIFSIIVLLAMIPIFTSLFNPDCPTCDCSSYSNQLAECEAELANPEVVYINQTIEKEVPVEKIIYNDIPVSITEISLTLILSLALTLFSFKIQLPKRLEERLEDLEKVIKFVKYGSLVLTILIFIKLASILLTLL